jgi:hypothetical protein
MAASVMFQNGLLRTLKLLWNLLERSAHQASIIQTAKTLQINNIDTAINKGYEEIASLQLSIAKRSRKW